MIAMHYESSGFWKQMWGRRQQKSKLMNLNNTRMFLAGPQFCFFQELLSLCA